MLSPSFRYSSAAVRSRRSRGASGGKTLKWEFASLILCPPPEGMRLRRIPVKRTEVRVLTEDPHIAGFLYSEWQHRGTLRDPSADGDHLQRRFDAEIRGEDRVWQWDPSAAPMEGAEYKRLIRVGRQRFELQFEVDPCIQQVRVSARRQLPAAVDEAIGESGEVADGPAATPAVAGAPDQPASAVQRLLSRPCAVCRRILDGYDIPRDL